MTVLQEKRRKTKEERKSERIIEYSPKKGAKLDRGTLDVWRNITVQEIANTANLSLGELDYQVSKFLI